MYSACRLKKSRDFRRVFKFGKSTAGRYFVMYFFRKKSSDNHARLGVSVSRKIGNAVVRIRIRRLVKEALRDHMMALPMGLDIVVIARGPSAEIEFEVVKGSLLELLDKALRMMKISLSTGVRVNGKQDKGTNMVSGRSG